MAKGAVKTAAARGKKPKEQRTPVLVQVEGFGLITDNLSKRLNRFYEALVFLNGLVEACMNSGRVRAPSDVYEPGESPHQVLECFVNKMAQVCDNVPFGATITSLAVLVRNYDHVHYVFASNQRNADEAEVAARVVRRILDDVGGAGEADLVDDGNSPLSRRILWDVLEFHVERIKTYRRNLLDRLRRCVADCGADDSVQGRLLRQELERFEALVEQQGRHTVDGRVELSVEESISIVRGAHSLRLSQAYEGLIERTRAGRMNQSEHWCDLQHYIGRLASYLRIPNAIIVARRRTPELFENVVDITFVPSSTPLPNPMKVLGPKQQQQRRRDSRSARSLLHRMMSAGSDEAQEAVYQGYAEDLQRCNLDRIIGSQCENPNFRPIVHCEVLLLDWLQRRFADDEGGGGRSLAFFREHRYIGCSKPTCRLCEYHFAVNSGGGGGGIQVRRGHRNVYANWAMPDISAEVPPAAAAARDRVIDKVLEKVREDVFAALKDKVSDRKRFDSITSSWQPTYQSLASASVHDDSIIAGMGGLSIAPREEFARRLSVQEDSADDEDKWSVGVAEDDIDEDEDGDGGASLSSE